MNESRFVLHFVTGEVPLKDEVYYHFTCLPPLPGETGTQYSNRVRAWIMTKPKRPSIRQRLKALFPNPEPPSERAAA